MSTPASIKKHPLHPMLVAFPIGLWGFALVCDLVRAFGGAEVWSTVALYSVAGGIVGAILAAIPGLVDFLSIDGAEMKRIGLTHLLVNTGALLLFAINLWVRFHVGAQSKWPLALSLIGVVGIGFGGWLGGEMVYVKGMAVEEVDRLSKKQEQRQSQSRKAS